MTGQSSLAAIKIHMDFGFAPYITDKTQQKEWGLVSKQLGSLIRDIRYRYKEGRHRERNWRSMDEKHGNSDL